MQTLKKATNDIQNNKISSLYVLFGSETYLIKEFIQLLKEKVINSEYGDLNYGYHDCNEVTIEDVVIEAGTIPFLSEKRLVCAYNASFLTGIKDKTEHNVETLLEFISTPSEFSTLVLIAPHDKLDERKKVVKELKTKACLVSCQPLKGNQLSKWISNKGSESGVILPLLQATYLANIIGNDLGQLSSEIYKLATYVGPGQVITNEVIDLLASPALDRDVFGLIDHVIQGNIKDAYRILFDCFTSGEEPIKILALFVRHFRIMLQVKLLIDQGNKPEKLASILGVHPYSIKKASEHQRLFSEKALRHFLTILADDDFKMKTGRVNKQLALQLFIAKVAEECNSNNNDI